LSWTQFRSLIYLDDPLKRDFYAEMCRIERWNTRTLQKKIGGMLFERTALSRKPEQLAREDGNCPLPGIIPRPGIIPTSSSRAGTETVRFPVSFPPTAKCRRCGLKRALYRLRSE
jgi:DUF1016 N-terminal domain